MQALIDNNGGELTLGLDLQHIAASDAHKIYSEKSRSRPIGGNLGTWSEYGFCADHTLDARMHGIKVTVKEAYKETDPHAPAACWFVLKRKKKLIPGAILDVYTLAHCYCYY